jgi:hypothetical protein
MTETNKFGGIQKVEGGFIVELNGEVQVTTSLQKAIKLVRDYLSAGQESEE